MKTLLVARRYNSDRPDLLGGVIVSSEMLIKNILNAGVEIEIVNTNKSFYPSSFVAYMLIVYKILINMKSSNKIFLNLNNAEVYLIGPIVTIFNSYFHKKVIVRVFGGDLHLYHQRISSVKKYLIDYTFRNADKVLLQTKQMIKYFDYLENIEWYPTCREKSDYDTTENFEKKFIFVGHVKKSKGIQQIFEAAQLLDKSYRIDIYGKVVDIDINQFNGSGIVQYKGMLKPEKVVETLSKYDVLIFPTFHEGEGYPGVIIESFSVGLPVITTDWNALNELVKNNFNGYLIPINDTEHLVQAIKMINDENYRNLRLNAKKSFQNFDCEKILNKIIKYIKN